MDFAIKAENLSKAYRLGEIGTGTLSHDLHRWWAKQRGKEDPFLKIGETNDRTSKGSSDVVWSLRDINFEIKEGDAVGIIGRNGAGKSTLLKVLSKVTSPTIGTIRGKGRIASLLEVGTGFHPELTGRENIFLNGAILGMKKKEIQRKFDEILIFSGVERYVDTPVKRYSSGMYVRLAFAVAAHLESEILIVDEVLAVGDAEFQKKCLGKMGDVSRGEGRTVLFVSHNMDAILSITNTSLLLNKGSIVFKGESSEAVQQYNLLNYNSANRHFEKRSDKPVYFSKIYLSSIQYAYDAPVTIYFNIHSNFDLSGLTIGVAILNELDKFVGHRLLNNAIRLKNGTNRYKIVLDNLGLVPGSYKCALAISRSEKFDILDSMLGDVMFTIVSDTSDKYLFSKWEKVWGYHFLKEVKLSEVELAEMEA